MLGYIISSILTVICLFLIIFLFFTTKTKKLIVPIDSQIPIIEAFNKTISGAAKIFGNNNHLPSPYFLEFDFYNKKPTKTLKILPKFKTYQQTSSYTCGPCSALMVMNYFGYTNISENQLAEEAHCGVPSRLNPHGQYGTTATDLATTLINHGFKCEYNSGNSSNPWENESKLKDFVIESIDHNQPILAMSVDWGGHWEVIIGIDDMGTESTADDILILADPFDSTDHRQDGYTIWSLERFYALWGISLMHSFPGEETWQYIRVSNN